MRREPFVAKVRDALGRRAGDAMTPAPDLADQPGRLGVPGADRVAAFSAAAEAVGVDVHVVTSEILPKHLAALCTDEETRASEVVLAVAGTGSVLVESGPDSPRAASLAPERWVAVVNASQIVDDLWDAVGRLDASGPTPSARTLITGPSKTADIEGVLITGVHGPREVVALVVTDR